MAIRRVRQRGPVEPVYLEATMQMMRDVSEAIEAID
jgi:hypothetical protein